MIQLKDRLAPDPTLILNISCYLFTLVFFLPRSHLLPPLIVMTKLQPHRGASNSCLILAIFLIVYSDKGEGFRVQPFGSKSVVPQWLDFCAPISSFV